MIRTVLALGVGFWLARQIYINQDKKEARKKEAQMKQKLRHFLRDNGLTKTESKEATDEIINDEL